MSTKSDSSSSNNSSDHNQKDDSAIEGEVHLKDLLKELQSDSELSDIQLQANDGVLIPANRCILAGRSKVFRAMLLGKYAEADQSVVKIDFDGPIIKSIVNYCYTNEFCPDSRRLPAQRKIIPLFLAADFFGLPGLKKKLLNMAQLFMTRAPASACAFYDESEAAPEIKNLAIKFIRQNSESSLLSKRKTGIGVGALSEPHLAEILRDQEMACDEIVLFKALQEWSRLDGSSHEETLARSSAEPCGTPSQSGEKRKREASDLSRHLSYKRIKPSDLSSIVSSSGLASSDQLLAAYKNQSLLYEKNHPLMTKRSPYWELTSSPILEPANIVSPNPKVLTSILVCDKPLSEGIHTWRIQLNYFGQLKSNWADQLGIVCEIPAKGRPLTASGCKGFAVDINGTVWAGKERHSVDAFPAFRKGCQYHITFTLDLRERGCLSIYVDGMGDKPQVVVKDIVGHAQFRGEDSVPAFFPAAAVMGASVTFLGFIDGEDSDGKSMSSSIASA